MRASLHNITNRVGGIRNIIAWLTIIVLIPALFFGLLQAKYHGVYSQIDEGTHISYAWSASHGRIPAKGDTVEQPILDDWACSSQTNAELPPAVMLKIRQNSLHKANSTITFIHRSIMRSLALLHG